MFARQHLIEELKQQGITHPKVIEALQKVPREKFLPPRLHNRAYDNTALPISCQQTISQPYIVALMTQALMDCPKLDKVLEVGTGSGYQTAILAQIFKEIFTIERIEPLLNSARNVLTDLGYTNIHYKHADGSLGWEKEAPFDGIIVTAAAQMIPRPLLEQLSEEGGLLVIPLGSVYGVQNLTLLKKTKYRIEEQILEKVCFVPLISD